MLSDSALALLRLHVERDGKIEVDDSNREAYRELAREGLMVPGHSFTRGREAFYALTELGRKLACVLERAWPQEARPPGDDDRASGSPLSRLPDFTSPSPPGSAAPRR